MGIEVPQDEPTPASGWSSARTRGFVVELPSGNKARVRRTLDLPDLIKSGKIPNPLSGVLSEVIENSLKSLDENTPVKPPSVKFSDVANAETIYAMLDIVDDTCVRVFIEPRVVARPPGDEQWDPPEDAITLDDLTLDDKMFVWQYAMGGSADLASFRTSAKATLDAAFHGADVQLPSEQPAGAV